MYRVDQAWLYGSVKPFFEQKGIKLLRDDLLHIEKCLASIPQDRHRIVMRGYFSVWNTKVAEKDGRAPTAINPRYEANVYLRCAAEKNSLDS